jgi:RNase P subunit RPR2
MLAVARDRMEGLLRMGGERLSAGDPASAARYVRLARKIGMRYNVRMSPAMRRSFCPSCSSYLSEGINARTRLKAGRVTRTCLACGAVTRMGFRRRTAKPLVAGHPQGTEAGVALNEGSDDMIEETDE